VLSLINAIAGNKHCGLSTDLMSDFGMNLDFEKIHSGGLCGLHSKDAVFKDQTIFGSDFEKLSGF